MDAAAAAAGWAGYLEHQSREALWSFRENTGLGNCTVFSELLVRLGCRWDFQGLPWCAVFIHAVFWQALGKRRAVRLLGYPWPGVVTLWRRMRRKKRLRGRSYRPRRGDLVFYAARGRRPCHVGIVVELTPDGFLSAEGNASDPEGHFPPECGGAAVLRHVNRTYRKIIGYADMGNKEEHHARFCEKTDQPEVSGGGSRAHRRACHGIQTG